MIRKRKVLAKEKYQIYEILIFFRSRIKYLLSLIEVLEFNFIRVFVENFEALLSQAKLILEDFGKRSLHQKY